MVGVMSIEQNNIIKIFSVAAVVLMPPTLVASIYGMNFKHMPELDWLVRLSAGAAVDAGRRDPALLVLQVAAVAVGIGCNPAACNRQVRRRPANLMLSLRYS